VTVPADAQEVLAAARQSCQRFGEHHDAIERVRARLAREPLDEQELASLCRSVGIPPDFDLAQFCWKPDYDPYFYQQLKKRSQNVYFLRDEYIFQLPRAIVAEVPQLGHASYVFAKPADTREFVRLYAAACRDDIRKNRGNVAQQLGFIGRVSHGSNPRTWLRALLSRAGEAVDYPLTMK
jgi:glycosyltransferase involved in cell wall biosynthesis